MKYTSYLLLLPILALALLLGCGNDEHTSPKNSTAQTLNLDNWDAITEAARGQQVVFNAWGGSEAINDYIAWVAQELLDTYGITLIHTKVDDIAVAVNRILGEHTAGKRDNDGSIDLVWINGENFRSMKEYNLLYGPFAEQLPSASFIDFTKPSIAFDFGTPTEGYEAPWGSAQMVFVYDSDRISTPPSSFADLIAYAEAHPGRVTYPKPPNYLGTTFLKQALYAVADDPSQLTQPVTDAAFTSLEGRLWQLIDRLHQVAWNSGTSFPSNGQDLFRLLNDREVDFALSFSPGEASANIKQGLLPPSARTFIFTQGTIGNTHFLAIPANAPNKEAALVTINFLLSPAAQLRKQHPDFWGDFTVIDTMALNEEWQSRFNQLPLGEATLRPSQLEPTLLEPHASWVEKIEIAWQERYL